MICIIYIYITMGSDENNNMNNTIDSDRYTTLHTIDDKDKQHNRGNNNIVEGMTTSDFKDDMENARGNERRFD